MNRRGLGFRVPLFFLWALYSLMIIGQICGRAMSNGSHHKSETAALHDPYDPKYDLRVSMEVRAITPHPTTVDPRSSITDPTDEFCDIEEDDSSPHSDGSDDDDEDDGCDLESDADDEENSNPTNGTSIVRVKDHRDSNEVESKTKKKDLSEKNPSPSKS